SRTNNAKELAEIYSAADIFINPTLEDTYPTTNLEAIACNTKVITFDVGGSKEAVLDNNNSIVNGRECDSLIDKIIDFSKDLS
ncbi:glycosyltransferase, partial [Staphylococcus aureus]|nr:glycosyltransferase [Staphylococcus aureus]